MMQSDFEQIQLNRHIAWLNKHNLIDSSIHTNLILCQDPDLYRQLYFKFNTEYNCKQYCDFFEDFRKWLKENYKCYSDGTCDLYFQNEYDLIYCRLKL